MVVETNKIEFNQEKKTGENPISKLIDKEYSIISEKDISES